MSTEIQREDPSRKVDLVIDMMEMDGLKENRVFPNTFFSEHLQLAEDSIGYAFAISEIRLALYAKGWVLSGRGQNGTGHILLPRERNVEEMARLNHAAINALRKAVLLGESTPLNGMSQRARDRHESMTEKLQLRLSLMSRKNAIAAVNSSKSLDA